MSDTTASLRRKIAGAGDLQSVPPGRDEGRGRFE